jgi:hypothetical protein
VAVARDVVRFGALTAAQLARRHFGALRTAENRLAALAAAGYLRRVRVWYRGPGVVLATPAGARLAAVGLPAARLRPLTLAHHLVVADVADALLARYAGGQAAASSGTGGAGAAGAAWVTERELRRDGLAAVRDRRGRLVDGVGHAPDGLLVLPPGAGADGDGRAARIAVEVELTPKGLPAYRRILRWYGGALDLDRGWWFGATPAVRERLQAVVDDERMGDLVAVAPLPAGVEVPAWG